MEKRPLDITILSAKGLKDIGTFSKMDVYVAVSLSSDPDSEQKTPVDTDGGSSPKWNHAPMKFTLDESELQMDRVTLEFRLRHERVLMGDKDVGEVYISVKELLDKAYDGKADEPVKYDVKKPNSEKVKGSIKFSYKFGEVHKIGNTVHEAPPMVDPNYSAPPPAEYHAHEPSRSYAPPPAHGAPYAHPPEAYPQAPPPAYGAPYAHPPEAYPQAPPVAGGYGYGSYQQPPPPGGYAQPGYPGGHQEPQKKGGLSTGAAVGLGAAGGLVGGLLIADMIEDSNEDAFEAGYDAGFDDGGDDF